MQELLVSLVSYLAQHLGGSTGWAIVALSAGVRVALLPLTLGLARRGKRRQEKIRALQPDLDRLKKTFEKDPQQLLKETMALYRQHGLGFFDFPALVAAFGQLPIFGMLYGAIGAALASGGRFYWIRSLAAPDGLLTCLVLVLSAASAYFMPGVPDGSRAAMTAVQLGVTFFIVWKLSAGYGLYWAASSAVGLVQTWWLRRDQAKAFG